MIESMSICLSIRVERSTFEETTEDILPKGSSWVKMPSSLREFSQASQLRNNTGCTLRLSGTHPFTSVYHNLVSESWTFSIINTTFDLGLLPHICSSTKSSRSATMFESLCQIIEIQLNMVPRAKDLTGLRGKKNCIKQNNLEGKS